MSRITYIPNRVIDTDGIADGASLFVYQTGTTTKVNLFLDEDFTIPTTNPYVVGSGAAVPALFHNYEGDVRLYILSLSGNIQDFDPYPAFITKNDVIYVAVEDFGAVGDGVTDDTVHIQAAIDHVISVGGGVVNFKGKKYRCNSTLTWSGAPVVLQGCGGNIQQVVGTILYFPNSATQTGCIRIKNGSLGYGAGSSVRDLTILGANGAKVSDANALLGLGSGLLSQCPTNHHNVWAQNLEGIGIFFLSAPSIADVSINCNLSSLYNCFGYACKYGRGAYGVDSNQMTWVGGGGLQNTAFGDFINGFLTTSLYSPIYEGNTTGGIRIGNIARDVSVFSAYYEAVGDLHAQLDAGGGGGNTIEFKTTSSAVPVFTDLTGMATNSFTIKGIKQTAHFGNTGGDGTGSVQINAAGELQLYPKAGSGLGGGRLQLQDNPLTANWFLYNLTGSPVFENGGVPYYTFGSTTFTLNSGVKINIGANQVVGPRQTGWTADTGTAKKTATATYAPGANLTYSATYVQAEQTATSTRLQAIEPALRDVTQEMKALKDALIAHGLIGT